MSDKTRKAVAAFMSRIGLEVLNMPPQKLNPGIAALRLELIVEEAVETCSALRTGNVVGTADGFADLKYVIVGAACAFGLPIIDCFPKPSQPVQFEPLPEISLRLMSRVLPLVYRMYRTTVLSIFDWQTCAAILTEIDGAISLVATADLGLPLEALFNEVHTSNMTKQASNSAIGFLKYPPGGKGPDYQPPAIETILRKQGFDIKC